MGDNALDSGDIDIDQFLRMDATSRSIGGMVGRMIDRAADFCKYASDTDHRGTVMEGPINLDEPFLTILMMLLHKMESERPSEKGISLLVALLPSVRARPRPIANH
jgi:hypothetical protein